MEVRERWTIDDLADVHEALDIKAEAEAHAHLQARRAAEEASKR